MRYLIVLLLAGCGSIQPRADAGKSFTIEHGSARFSGAMDGAVEHCGKLGMDAKHLGTDRGRNRLMSRFECVPN